MMMTSRSAQLMGVPSILGRTWWLILLYGVISILFGLFAVITPMQAGVSLVWVIGLFALAEGVLAIAGAFFKDLPVSRAYLIVYALISLVFGAVSMLSPEAMALALVMVMGIWFVLGGIMRVMFAIRVRKEIEDEWTMILSGVVAVLLGILMVALPMFGLVFALIWIGVGALFYGGLQVYAAFQIRELSK